MTNAPSIAIVIIAYDRIEYLRNALEGAVSNVSCNTCVYLINNGGGEKVSNIVQEFSAQVTEIYFPKNIGMGGAANYALDCITADYVLITHDDDILDAEYSSCVTKFIEKNPNCSMIGTSIRNIDADGHIISVRHHKTAVLSDLEYIEHYLLGNIRLQWSGTLFNRNIISSVRFDFENYQFSGDAIFMLQLVKGNKIGIISKNLFSYRVHDSSDSNAFDLKNLILLWEKNFIFHQKFLREKFYKKNLFHLHRKSVAKTLAGIALAQKNKCDFELVCKSRHFNFWDLSFSNKKRIFIHFISLFFR